MLTHMSVQMMVIIRQTIVSSYNTDSIYLKTINGHESILVVGCCVVGCCVGVVRCRCLVLVCGVGVHFRCGAGVQFRCGVLL